MRNLKIYSITTKKNHIQSPKNLLNLKTKPKLIINKLLKTKSEHTNWVNVFKLVLLCIHSERATKLNLVLLNAIVQFLTNIKIFDKISENINETKKNEKKI